MCVCSVLRYSFCSQAVHEAFTQGVELRSWNINQIRQHYIRSKRCAGNHRQPSEKGEHKASTLYTFSGSPRSLRLAPAGNFLVASSILAVPAVWWAPQGSRDARVATLLAMVAATVATCTVHVHTRQRPRSKKKDERSSSHAPPLVPHAAPHVAGMRTTVAIGAA